MLFLLWLTSLSVTMSRSLMLLQMALFHSFRWRSNIPLFVYMHHTVFIHSSVNGHLGCLHVLATVNRAAVDTGYIYPFWSCFSLNICPGVGLQSHQSVQFSCSVVSDSLQPHGLHHPWLPCPSLMYLHCSSSICSFIKKCTFYSCHLCVYRIFLHWRYYYIWNNVKHIFSISSCFPLLMDVLVLYGQIY